MRQGRGKAEMRTRAKGRAEERRGRAVLEEMDGGPTKAGRRLLGLGWAGQSGFRLPGQLGW